LSPEPSAAIVGAGAAGLMTAISAARALAAAGHPSGPAGPRIVLLDGARRLGAKILVAGGGRCNVTHERVTAADFNGSTRPAIRRVLQRFGVGDAIEFFAGLGVRLVRESTGKLFPCTNRARDVLDALVNEARRLGVEIVHPWRVAQVRRVDSGYQLETPEGDRRHTDVAVLATGGQSLPKSGSDGHGFALARSLGHSTTAAILPALVPLVLDGRRSRLTGLSGLSARASLEVRSASGRRLQRSTGELLCTHFGISGPVALDISRHFLAARLTDAEVALVADWLPDRPREAFEAGGRALGAASVVSLLRRDMPERLARLLCEEAGVDPTTQGHTLRREDRQALQRVLYDMRLPVTGHRGFAAAEATAGGVPLAELRLDTMESRVSPGLYLVGELLDVDGRLGGFNFQWAWASGYVAGLALARTLSPEP
jgi:hypothetical protein